MWRSITTFLVMSIISTTNLNARGASLAGNELKSTLQGRVLNLSTQLGALPIRYRANGTMTGQSSRMAGIVGYSSDKGRWWVNGTRLCQKWRKLFDGEVICYQLRKTGSRIYWSGGGRSGSAYLSN